MPSLEILHDIIKIARIIHDQVKLVQRNQADWESLIKVIRQVVHTLEGLSELPRRQNFENSLGVLHTQIQEANMFLGAMITMTYFELFFKAGRHQRQIEGYRQAILGQLPILHLGLTAEILVDREEDRQADRPRLSIMQKAITRPPSPTGEEYYEQAREIQEIQGDFQQALPYYERSAQKGYAKSLTCLGVFSLERSTTDVHEIETAKKYLEQASEQGHALADYNLGRMYEKGIIPDGEKNLNSALFYYRQAQERDPQDRYIRKISSLESLSPPAGIHVKLQHGVP